MQLRDWSNNQIAMTLKDRIKCIYKRYGGYDLDSFGLYQQGIIDVCKALDIDLEDVIEQIECDTTKD